MELSTQRLDKPRCCGCIHPAYAGFATGFIALGEDVAAVALMTLLFEKLQCYFAILAGIVLLVTYGMFLYGFIKKDPTTTYPFVVVQICSLLLYAVSFVAVLCSTIYDSHSAPEAGVIYAVLLIITGTFSIAMSLLLYGLINYLIYLHRFKIAQVHPNFPKPVIANGAWASQPNFQFQQGVFCQPPPDYDILMTDTSKSPTLMDEKNHPEVIIGNLHCATEPSKSKC